MNDGLMLRGLKEICGFCKSNRHSVLLWIRENGFPAKRVLGTKKWTAFTDEIIDWFRKNAHTIDGDQ